MRNAPETGESVAVTERRRGRIEWPRIADIMRTGVKLVRHPKTKRYYADGMGSFTESTVQMLRKQGKIVMVGVHAYDLTEAEKERSDG